MDSKHIWFFFILCIAGTVAQDECQVRDTSATCEDRECSDTRTCRKASRQCECSGNCGWSCVRTGCQLLPVPANGVVTYSSQDRSVGSIANFSCSVGYTLQGDTEVECSADKTWIVNNEVSCIEDCAKDLQQADQLGRQCMKECTSDSDCLRNRKCVCDGVCGMSCIRTEVANLCNQSLVQEENADVIVNPTTSVFGSIATITCLPGYESSSIDGNSEIERDCLGSGDWSEGSLTCIPENACRDPPVVVHALHTDDKPYYERGYVLFYNCNSGYHMVSERSLTCQGGTWSNTVITCQPKSCGHPGDLVNGRSIGTVYSFLSSVTYVCNDGYVLQGTAKTLCQANQQWTVSENERSCRLVRCPQLRAPDNGGMDGNGNGYGDQVSFSCNAEFSLDGESTLTCQNNETWSAAVPRCTAYCEMPSDRDNENIVWNTNSHCLDGASQPNKCGLSYSCTEEDYVPMSDIVIWVCKGGMWNKIDEPSCKWTSCNATDLPLVDADRQGGQVQLLLKNHAITHQVKHNAIEEVTCPDNYKIRNSVFFRCVGGEWQTVRNRRLPVCIPVIV